MNAEQPQDTSQEALIARAYAHMDDVSEAHARGEETADEKRLRDAREGIEEGDDEGSAVTSREGHARSIPRAYRPKPSAAAEAWLIRTRQERERKTLTLTDPQEATDKWRTVQHSQGAGRILPADAGQRSESVRRSISVQVWTWVRSTPGFIAWVKGWKSDEEFHTEVTKWLPRTFLAPLPDLCGADETEQENGRKEATAETRLMPGMARQEDI